MNSITIRLADGTRANVDRFGTVRAGGMGFQIDALANATDRARATGAMLTLQEAFYDAQDYEEREIPGIE